MAEPGRPWFFVHVMKTGGTTMRAHIEANFDRTRRYPFHKLDPRGSYWQLPPLLAVAPQRRPDIDIYAGHLPFFATTLVGEPELRTMSVLRDPVDRTVSHLAMEQRDNRPDRSFEEIFDDPLFRARFASDHMTKVFAAEPGDGVRTCFDPVPLDAERLQLAKQRVASLTVLGVQESFDDLLDELERRWGWTIGPVPPQRAAGAIEASDGLRRRIEDANRFDRELYEFALDQLRDRGAKISRGPRS